MLISTHDNGMIMVISCCNHPLIYFSSFGNHAERLSTLALSFGLVVWMLRNNSISTQKSIEVIEHILWKAFDDLLSKFL